MTQVQIIPWNKQTLTSIYWQPNTLEALIGAYDPITLAEMDGVALLNRVDTKFVLSSAQLLDALRCLQPAYRVLTIDYHRAHHYRTLYYDTADFELFHQHVTHRAHIYKVRSREYLDTQLSYLEVKHKDVRQRTEKSRLPIRPRGGCLDERMQDFLRGAIPMSGTELRPTLWNTFRRITLVSKRGVERLTIDVDLCFRAGREELRLDGIAVAEVKQDELGRGSASLAEMRRQGIREMGFSKYCYGAAHLYPALKANSQKEKQLKIEKLQNRGQ